MYAKNRSMTSGLKWGVLAPVLVLTIVPAVVQAGTLYAGVGYGNTKIDSKGACGTIGRVLNSGYTCSQDDKDNSWKLLGGYELMRYLAFEFGYENLGKYTASASGTARGTSTATTASSRFEAKGFNFSVVGMFPFTNELGVFARFGTFRWNVDASASTPNGGVSVKDTKPGFTPNNVGLGLKYSMNKTMDLRLEWERFKDVGDGLVTGQGDIDRMSLGLLYRFQ